MTPEEWNALAQLRARHGPGGNSSGPNVLQDAGHYDSPAAHTARLEALVRRVGNSIDVHKPGHYQQTMGEPS